MTSLATPVELAAHLQTATADEAAAGNQNILDTVVAQQALDAASAKVRGAAGWSITEETVTRTISASGRVFLPVMNLTEVTVTAGGQPLPDWAAVVSSDGWIDFYPYWSQVLPVVVTYTAGYDPVPDGPKSLCLEIAADIYTNPTQEIQTTYGAVTEQYRPRATAANPENLRTDPRLAQYVVMAFA